MKNSLLTLSFIVLVTMVNAQCSQLFYSEYVEGSSHSKAVEIYNPTNATVSLVGYRIARYSNGGTSISDYYDLTGSVAAYDAYVVTSGVATPDINGAFCDPVLYAMADEHGQSAYPGPLFMNGDDAITLEVISSGAIIDIIGKIGEDPGNAWTDDASAGYTDANGGAWWTRDHDLIRKSSITGGVTTNPGMFDPTVQWDSLPEDTWTNLGMHTCDCLVGVEEVENSETFFLFPNPAENIVLIKGTEILSSIEVYNSIGELVISSNAVEGRADYNLNIEDLETGLYIIKINFKNEAIATKKLIKK